MLLVFENLSFVKLNISYRLFKFQIFWLSGSNFMEVSVRPPKHHYDVIMTSFLITEFPKLAYFVEHDIGYQLSKFQCSRMSGSNFMEGGGNPPPCCNEIKKPSACRVKERTLCKNPRIGDMARRITNCAFT